MVNFPSGREVLESMLGYIVLDIKGRSVPSGILQLNIAHDGEALHYFIDSTTAPLSFTQGQFPSATVSLRCTLFDWLELAAGRLNPVFGVLTRRLVFEGDVGFMKRFMKTAIPKIDISRYSDPPSSFEKNPVRNWKKPSRILVLSGSPHGSGGYTHFYLQYLLSGMKREGVEPDLVTVSEKRIALCTGCLQCFVNDEGRCKIRDDMDEIIAKRNECDMLVLAFPLYVDALPATLKAVLDRSCGRSHPYLIEGRGRTRRPRRKRRDQALVFFSVCSYPETYNYDAIRVYAQALSHHYHMPLCATIFRPGATYIAQNPLAYKKLHAVIHALEKAGSQLVRNGRVDRRTMATITQPPDTPATYHQRYNVFWHRAVEARRSPYA